MTEERFDGFPGVRRGSLLERAMREEARVQELETRLAALLDAIHLVLDGHPSADFEVNDEIDRAKKALGR